jgi:hypothetical protein
MAEGANFPLAVFFICSISAAGWNWHGTFTEVLPRKNSFIIFLLYFGPFILH